MFGCVSTRATEKPTQEHVVEPKLAIVDAHLHRFNLIKDDNGMVPRIARVATGGLRFAQQLPVQAAQYITPGLLNEMGGRGVNRGHRVVGTVIVETPEAAITQGLSVDQDENVTDGEQLQQRPPPHSQIGLIAYADLSVGEQVENTLKHYKKNPLVRGITSSLAWACDPEFFEGFALLAKYGFVYDVWLYSANLEKFTDLARTFPETTMVLNHLGLPLSAGNESKDETMPLWKDRMLRLAEHSNAYVKIGGLGMRSMGFGFDDSMRNPTSHELAEAWGPYILFVIETFGVDRVMMESNFPMDMITCSYTVYWNALKRVASGYSLEEKRKMFELNAKCVYRLE